MQVKIKKRKTLYMWLFESILNCILGFAELLSTGILHMDLGKHSLVIYCLNFLLLVCLKDENSGSNVASKFSTNLGLDHASTDELKTLS